MKQCDSSNADNKYRNDTKVVCFNPHLIQRIRNAKLALSGTNDEAFFEAYSWVFNSICIDPNGFAECCEVAGMQPYKIIQQIEKQSPTVHQRFNDLVLKPRRRY